jgi:hypothetical protein
VCSCPGPGAPDKLAQQGQIAFDYGNYWFKGQAMGSGQCPVKKYNRALRDLIAGGKASPSFLVSHELPLDQALEGYKNFDNREDGWTKSSSTRPKPERVRAGEFRCRNELLPGGGINAVNGVSRALQGARGREGHTPDRTS